jgi:hypothetical protein
MGKHIVLTEKLQALNLNETGNLVIKKVSTKSLLVLERLIVAQLVLFPASINS